MLELSKIAITVDKKCIASGIDLSIAPGAIHALMGPNGSGKSSLSLTLAGHPLYKTAADSKISLDNVDLTTARPEDRVAHGLFLTFQNPTAIPGLTVKQLIKLLVDHVRQDTLSISEMLAEMKQYSQELQIKTELLDRSVNDNFSGGEKKRIEMLQLLMARPKYAIIDEIDSGLDIDAIKAIGTAINHAKHTFQTGFLVITHYRRILDYVEPDYVHVLAAGKMVLSGGSEVIEEIEHKGYGNLIHHE